MKKRCFKIVVSTHYFGGIGGSERRLKSIVESLPEHEFYIFAPKVMHEGFIPTTPNYHLNAALDKSETYDLYIYFAGMIPYYLGKEYRFLKKIALINGTEKFPNEQLFDYAILSSRNGAQCLRGVVKTKFAIPNIAITHPKKQKKVKNLPSGFFLTVFNPYGPVKGKGVLAEMAQYCKFPIVWCYNDTTRYRHFGTDYKTPPIDNVIQLRNISQSELYYLYEKATAYVCFSLNEGFGWAVADAFIYDLPIISRNTGIVTLLGDQKGIMRYRTEEELIGYLAEGCLKKPEYNKAILDKYSYCELIDRLFC